MSYRYGCYKLFPPQKLCPKAECSEIIRDAIADRGDVVEMLAGQEGVRRCPVMAELPQVPQNRSDPCKLT